MDKAKKLIEEAIKEIRKDKCSCEDKRVCRRCLAIGKLTSAHKLLSVK